ncbi:MAG: TIGR01777 family oxidoreductase [bacterium]
MRVLLSGSTGLLGSALVSRLEAEQIEVVRLVRPHSRKVKGIEWDPAAGKIDKERLEGFDAVVHLAGENIAGRWTKTKKERIRSSRVEGTRLLAGALAKLKHSPKVLVCASAIGYYGSRGHEILKESSGAGRSFLGQVCREWEQAAKPVADKDIRVVWLRFGVILSPEGGALKQMLLPFRMGLGGIIGDGNQYVSWVAIDDAVGIVVHALNTPGLRGPVNAVAPNPVTNREFTKALGRALGRPTILPVPEFLVRLVFGEMADATILASARVEPSVLKATGYAFRFSEIESALRHVLGAKS